MPKVFTSTGKTPFRVVHFSDVHIDRSYTVCRFFFSHSLSDIQYSQDLRQIALNQFAAESLQTKPVLFQTPRDPLAAMDVIRPELYRNQC